MSENTELMATRYGKTPRAARNQKFLGIATALGFTAVLGAWLVWGAVLETPASLQTRDLGYVAQGETSIQVNFEVTTAPGTEVTCAVQALNASFGIVGWRIVPLAASPTWTRTFSETVRTTEPPVTGLLYECWLQ